MWSSAALPALALALLLPYYGPSCWPDCWPDDWPQLAPNPTAGNLNPDNGIPDIRIQAYRTRSAFGFGIPPWDVFIPREIQKTDGYNQVAMK